jgi:hypothetical protein
MRTNALSTAGRVAVASLAFASTAIAFQRLTGVGAQFPTVPPGLILLLVAIAAHLLIPRWWAAAVGTAIPLMIAVGGVVAPEAREAISDPGDVDAFVGTLAVFAGAAVAAVAGAITVVETSQPTHTHSTPAPSPSGSNSAAAGPGRERPSRRRLPRTARRLVLLAHLVAALGWLGVDVVLGFLAVTGFTSNDPGRVAASYLALDTFAVPLLLVFGLSTLASGLMLSIGSGLGVIRHWWVAIKLAINVVLSGLVLLLLQPRLTEAASQAGQIDSTLSDRLGGIPIDMLFPAFVSGAALLAASLLGTFKPWGPTPYGRRRTTTMPPATTCTPADRPPPRVSSPIRR